MFGAEAKKDMKCDGLDLLSSAFHLSSCTYIVLRYNIFMEYQLYMYGIGYTLQPNIGISILNSSAPDCLGLRNSNFNLQGFISLVQGYPQIKN